ncbi:MAG: IS21-like element helper ATPase IstB [Bacteroidota bacterium]
MEEIKTRLKALRLRGFADNLEHRISQAMAANLSYEDFLCLLLEDQEALKFTHGYQTRLRKSRLDACKTLDNYQFSKQPSVNPKQIAQLATCEFIKNKSKFIMIGISGVGKSFLTNAIGLKAVEKGYKVLQYNSNDLVDLLLLAQRKDGFQNMVKEICSFDFVIIDEMCLVEYPPGGTILLMRLLEKLDEHISVAFTTNRELSEWVRYFPDEVVASAFVDRTIHQATIIRIIGDSGRADSHRQ